MVASSRDKHFVAYFTDQLRGREKEKGIKTKKRVKLAAKMLMIAWTLDEKTGALRSQVSFWTDSTARSSQGCQDR
jgi:hypothetical protein